MKDRVRSSRRRYAQFVDDYRHRRLDETGTARESGGAKTPSPKRREYLREYLRWLAPHKRTVALVMTLAALILLVVLYAASRNSSSITPDSGSPVDSSAAVGDEK